MLSQIKNKQIKGFTLLEVLIAIFLFAIVASTMFGAYLNVFHTVRGTEDDARVYKMARKCLERILMDLESVYVSTPPQWKKPDINDEKSDPYQIKAETESVGKASCSNLQFVSLSHVPQYGDIRKEGLAKIIYYCEKDEQNDDNVFLKRADLDPEAEFEKGPKDVTICEWITSFKLTFFDEEDESHDTWDSESDDVKFATPQAVNIRLELKDPRFESDSEPLIFQTRATLFMLRQPLKD